MSSPGARPERESFGLVRSPDLHVRPNGFGERGSLLAQEIFGPVRHFLCACSSVGGRDRAGEVCARCGVTCLGTEARGERWGHIDVPCGFVRPSSAPAIAQYLSCSPEKVLAIARFEAWLDGGVKTPPYGKPGAPFWEIVPDSEDPLMHVNVALRRLGALPEWAEADYGKEEGWYDAAMLRAGAGVLERALRDRGVAPEGLVERVFPVPPPLSRPFEPRPGGLFAPGADNVALSRVVCAANLVKRLLELGEDTVARLAAERAVQVAVEEAVAALSKAPPPRWLAPRPITADHLRVPGAPMSGAAYPVPTERSELAAVRAVAFVSESEVLLDLACATVRLDVETGVVRGAFRSTARRLVGVTPSGRFAYFFESLDGIALSAIDLATLGWCEVLPEEISSFPRFDDSGISLVSRSDSLERPLTEGEIVMPPVWSPCGELLWLKRVLRPDASIVIDPWWDEIGYSVERHVRPDGALVDEAPEDDDDGEINGEGVRAFALVEDTWWLVDQGHLFEGIEPIAKLLPPFTAAAFSTGGRLVLADDKTVSVFALEPKASIRCLHRWSVEPLIRSVASGDPRIEVSVTALYAALSAYGTLERLADASEAALSLLSTADTFQGEEPMGAEEARRILELARKARPPRKLRSRKLPAQGQR